MFFTSLLVLFSTNIFAADSINKIQPDRELTIQGITLAKTTLNEVKAKFKSKEIYHQGDAGETLYALCFKTANGSTIAFESGEMGGADHTIDAISINSPSTPYRLNKICEKSSAFKGKLTINGLSLGMSPDLIKTLKGKPTKSENDYLEYSYNFQEKTEKGTKDTTSDLKIEFKNSAASEIKVSKIETN